ncbi:MAG TPA: DUF4367 domain-containing protein [Candidatus Fimenecus excrementigallinarum]|uniref:DUF4367 domain-containing protein n=1 Tax=Candidatus Fimenecus excrementigallinarum TaxID=2840816 RepID=A0A9D1IE84_9FIRM|nr:DUF4367 domain-containing protein [Candidatus Fimenecus excrementigallinarum]
MENAKELFIRAFLEAERLDNAGLPGEDGVQWTFSDRFETSMDRLIRKNNRVSFSTRRTVTKSLLAAIVAVVVLFAGLMSVSATRKPILEFVKKIFPQYNEISLSENSAVPAAAPGTEYTLAELPDGYALAVYKETAHSFFSVWKNSAGEEIAFSQNPLDTSFTVDNEHKYRELEINGFPAYFTEDEAGAFLRWTDGRYWFAVNVPASAKGYIGQGTAPRLAAKERALADLPDGFVLETYEKDDLGVFSVWKNSAGEEIAFSRSPLDTSFTVDNEHRYRELTINGYEAYQNVYDRNAILLWTDGAHWYNLSVPARYQDAMFDLAESITGEKLHVQA